MSTALASFHPAVANWFSRTFVAATPPQEQAWPAIQAQRHVLIAAPTGSGKTLAAFLAAIDRLVREGLDHGLSDETHIVYVSPLKALSNDIRRNLEAPLAGIREELQALGLPELEIRTFVRTGDTPQSERNSMRKRPPHIVVTTPESLYILLGSESGRRMLGTTRTVIVDEIHAMVGGKRGLHLAISLERLEALTGRHLTRIGLSATQKPIEEVARFLVGTRNVGPDGNAECTIIDSGHVRDRDLALEVPGSPLEAVMSGDVWTEVYDRLAELVSEHRTTLVFVNTRRHAERVARHLSERIGENNVTAHHGSMAKELRFDAESRLKSGALKALIATASLELGIDIGDVDLVCQLGSPRSIAAFLQRVGRSGHSVGGTPKGRLFPLSRDDLVECAALLDAVRRQELDRLRMPSSPLDVLAQQIVAETAARDCPDDELFTLLRGAYPYRNLTREEFDDVIKMLAEGYSTRRGRHGALIYHDAVNHTVRPRPSARLTAITSGGTIPDNADYQVLLEPQATFVGTVNEDFAVESLQGDIFQLGNVSYRILRVEQGKVRVADAHGEPPNIPFWLGEAPGRSDELSQAVSRLRSDIAHRLVSGLEPAVQWLAEKIGIVGSAAVQLVSYLAAARTALGALPTQETLIFERFFDEAGGMQLVIHSPFGSRLNRAWGLALRKRFCRSFNFELQAAATEDTIILSLTTAHSFELADVARYLHSNTARPILVQALCAAPMFTARWRWSATIALALPRFRGGKKVAAPLARMAAEDLLTSIFPDQVACAENLPGELEIPDHPLIRQTIRDCLEEAMDAEGFEQLLRNLEAGRIQVLARDVVEPSPLALEVLSARPYAYLDDAPLEERRTQAVMSRRWLDPQTASDIGKLDVEAIQRVRDEAWPDAANADELHDAMLWLTFLTEDEVARHPGWRELIAALVKQKRVTGVGAPAPAPVAAQPAAAQPATASAAAVAPAASTPRGAHALWVTAERVPLFLAAFPNTPLHPSVEAPAAYDKPWSREEALIEIVRGRLEGLGPVTASAIASSLNLPQSDIDIALAALQAEGFAMRGQFETNADEWCERRLLARIHRYTVKRLRAEIEPIAASDYLRFLFEWQRVTPEGRMEGPDAVGAVLGQLEGFEAPASAWETEILPSRISEYEPAWLDEQCLAGRFVWTRLAHRSARKGDSERGAAPVRSTPIALLARRNIKVWSSLSGTPDPSGLSVRARVVAEYIQTHGASFFDEIADGAGLLPSQAEEALAELVALGIVNSDSFGGLRALLVPSDRRRPTSGGKRRRRIALFGMDAAGRWALIRRQPLALPDGVEAAAKACGPESTSAAPSEANAGAGATQRQREAAASATNSGTMAARLHDRIQDDETIEHVARTLLRRWGVVFWRLLAREADWLPPWRELLMCFRRLEARGEIRGGRFVAGFTGEQYAAPEAIGLLRDMRHRPKSQSYVSLSGADPLNLVGIVTPGTRLPALSSNRVLYRDGVPIALLAGGEVKFLEQMEPKEQWEAQNLLLRRHVPAVLADFA
ncbi:MAG: DEAD/DEAH box helicase [Proteobacteria bacterium]|nr:DEAD/DEAH box helicase [Pseudomonadota bacterium]